MDYLVIEGVRPWDGRYELDLVAEMMTTREWGWVKRFSDYLPATFIEGLEGNDPELFAVLAVIALHRAEKIKAGEARETFDRFADVPYGSAVRFELGDRVDAVEDDADPLSQPNSSANGSTSAESSNDALDLPDSRPSDTGDQYSEPPELVPARWGT